MLTHTHTEWDNVQQCRLSLNFNRSANFLFHLWPDLTLRRIFQVNKIFPVEILWVLTPFPKNSIWWEYKPRSSLCTHMHPLHGPKRRPRRINSSNKNSQHAPSMKTECDYLSTSMIGIKKTRKNLTEMVNPRDTARERRRWDLTWKALTPRYFLFHRTTLPSRRSMPSTCPTRQAATRWSVSARPSAPLWSAWCAVSWCTAATTARSWWPSASSSTPSRSSTCWQER